MVDISKKKEDAKKEIRSLLLSAPVGLTLAELERDYCLFMGNKLPSTELGYANAEEFLQDIPDTVQMTYKAGTLVLTGISDVTTKHIQKLVSNQRLDARKNWATLKISTAPALPMGHKTGWNKWHSSAYNESVGRSIYSFPDQGWRHQTVHPLRDIRQAELRSDSRYRTHTSPLDSPHARPCSYSQHHTVRPPPLLRDIQLAEPCLNTYDRSPRTPPLLQDFRHTDPHSKNLHQMARMPPLLRNIQQARPCTCSQHRNVGIVPLFIRERVDRIVKTFSMGVPLIHFPNIYRKHFGCTLDFWGLGFSSLYDFLSSLGDVVTLKKSSTGETWVMRQNNFQRHPFYNGPVSKHRPVPAIVYKTDHVQFPRGRTIQTGNSILAASTDAEKTTKAQSKNQCDMFTLDVEKANHLPTPSSVTHNSFSSHSNKTQNQLTSHLDEVHDSPTSQLDESHSSADLGTSCNIPLVVQDHIRQIMEERQRGLYASRLPFQYWNMFKEELPVKKLGYTSVVEFANQLPHIIKVERPHPHGDWHLLPASVQIMSEISDRTLTTNPDTKRMISSFHTDGSTRETVAKTLGMQYDELPLEDMDRVCKEEGDPGNACATANVDACNNDTDFSDVLSISALEQALSALEVKRNRLLKRIILENDCSPQSVDELTDIEQNMTRVGTRISQLCEFENNPDQTIDVQLLTSDLEEPLRQKSVTELGCSKPSGQIKSMQKVAPMRWDLLSQKEPVMKPTNTSAQTTLDVTLLLREQILLNQILMERLNLFHEIKNGNLLQQNPWPFQSSTVLQPYQGFEQLNHLLQVNQLPTFPQSALNSGLTTLNIGAQTSMSLAEPH